MTIEGKLEATATSYVPTTAYVFIHIIQVSIDENIAFIAIDDHPKGKAADEKGSSRNVTGSENLHVISKAQPKGETNMLCIKPRSAKLEVVPNYEKK